MKRWPSEASVKFFDETFFKKVSTLTLVGVSQREARETAKRLSRTVGQLPSQPRLPPCQLSRRESQVSPPPLGEVSCLWHDGEGNLPTARTCVSGSHRRGVQPPVSPAGSVSPERSPLGTRTPRREMRAQALGRFARPPARTCAILLHRRGVQPPPSGANCPVRSRTAN